MKKTFAILGLGRFGIELARELSALNVEVIVIDKDEDNIRKVGDFVDQAFICDINNEEGLRDIGVHNVDHAIVAIGSDIQATILATLILKDFAIPKITVRVDDAVFVPVIKKIGATDVVSPQKLAGTRLANKIVSDTFLDYYNLSGDYGIVKILVDEKFVTINIQDIKLRNKFGVNLLLIERSGKLFPPQGSDDIIANDILFVLGEKKLVKKFDDFINGEFRERPEN